MQESNDSQQQALVRDLERALEERDHLRKDRDELDRRLSHAENQTHHLAAECDVLKREADALRDSLNHGRLNDQSREEAVAVERHELARHLEQELRNNENLTKKLMENEEHARKLHEKNHELRKHNDFLQRENIALKDELDRTRHAPPSDQRRPYASAEQPESPNRRRNEDPLRQILNRASAANRSAQSPFSAERTGASPLRKSRGDRENKEEPTPAVQEYNRLKESGTEEPRGRRRAPETEEEQKEQMMKDYSKRLLKSIEKRAKTSLNTSNSDFLTKSANKLSD